MGSGRFQDINYPPTSRYPSLVYLDEAKTSSMYPQPRQGGGNRYPGVWTVGCVRMEENGSGTHRLAHLRNLTSKPPALDLAGGREARARPQASSKHVPPPFRC